MNWLRMSPNPLQVGMTLFEMILAMMMLIIFTGSVAMVMQFTTTFMAESDRELVEKSGCDADIDPETCSKGLLVDHANLQIAMDQLVDILVQPAVDAKANSVLIGLINTHCTRSPITDWNLSGLKLHSPTDSRFLPPEYKFCLWQTATRPESPLQDLISTVTGAKPGLYVLQAVPIKLSPSSLPTRRLFCRPQPFC
jgi:hypothetical protein